MSAEDPSGLSSFAGLRVGEHTDGALAEVAEPAPEQPA